MTDLTWVFTKRNLRMDLITSIANNVNSSAIYVKKASLYFDNIVSFCKKLVRPIKNKTFLAM